MNYIISFIFSIVLLIFGILIVVSLYQDDKTELEILQMQNDINIIKEKFDVYCSNPFSGNKFNFKSSKNTLYYQKDNKICAQLYDEIYCEKTKCSLKEKIIINKTEYEISFLCEMLQVDNLYEIKCE